MEDSRTRATGLLVDMEEHPRATVAIGVLGVLGLAYLTNIVLQWYRLSHIPGPWWAAFSKAWMVKESLKGRQPTAIKEVTDKYGEFTSFRTRHLFTTIAGSLARIGPNELVTDDPEVLRRMMAVRSAYERGPCKRYPFQEETHGY